MSRFVRFAAVAFAATALYASPSLAAGAAGTWNIVADAQGQQFKSTMTVAEAGGAYTVDVQPVAGGGDAGGLGPMKSTVSEVKLEGSVLSFKQHLASEQFKIDLTYKLTITGDALAGEANSDFGPTAITGTRAS